MFFEGLIVAPVGQGGAVEVGGVGDEGACGEDAGELGEQALVHGAGGAVGVGGEPGGFGQDVEAGEEAGATVHAPDVVGTVAADVGELEGEEGEHGLERGEGTGTRVAGEADGLVDAVAAEEGEEAEDAGGAFGLEQCGGMREEGDGCGSAFGSGAGGGTLGAGAAGEAGEALGEEQVADGALGGRVRGGGVEAGLDGGDGEVELAEADDFVVEVGGGGAEEQPG